MKILSNEIKYRIDKYNTERKKGEKWNRENNSQ